ncbi:hypothetical protein [Streptomyces qinzhouensis]|uniref:Uncharacterized protein n=1 Tax=Streptomyces qinzhouensis TaxID=2599401 RepID=A0A5B8JQ57_9ACTN|nr:hypothetical protein [Streptomyces qinzhouensis]QDY80000.1 hypothetical protein FQU76_29575 [Streptomyces qinzhouensis]
MAFMRYKSTGFDWALAYPEGEWRVLFGRGANGALISEQSLVASGPLAEIEPRLAGRGEARQHFSDGALMKSPFAGTWSSIFFQGDRAQLCDWKRNTWSEGPWTWVDNWDSGLPSAYRSQLDALLQVPDGYHWQTSFFKGPRVLTLHKPKGLLREGLITDGPEATGCDGWAKLPVDFQGDFDHVVPYRPASDGTRQTLLIKGDQGLILNWRTGVLVSGALNALGVPGLAALPHDFRTPHRPLTGRWSGTADGQRIDLRIDLEGERALNAISGDIFTITGSTTAYSDSFRATAPVVQQDTDQHRITQSNIKYAHGSPLTRLSLTVPRSAAGGPAPQATLRLESPDGTQSKVFTCSHAGKAFRSVEMETDSMEGTTVFQQYDTSRSPTPPGYRNRVLTLASAFAEAGIDLVGAGTSNTVTDTSGADLRWSNAELHAAMTGHFSLHRDVPQWKLWTFVATSYAEGDGTLGILFDTFGSHRQGTAVFHTALARYGLTGTRAELFTYVHEIGHAFNMLHSWQKPLGKLGPNWGRGDLSWMNYAQEYNNGKGRVGTVHFWEDFPFRFTDGELRHLRHGFYRHVVPGGDNWTVNAALVAGEAFTAPAADESGLALTLGGKTGFAYGEPVMAEVKLSRTGTHREVTAAEEIGGHSERTSFAITDPSGRTRVFRPPVRRCAGHGQAEATTTLNDQRPAVYATAYLGYGGEGLYFAEPGRYQVTAVHQALDGSRIVSPTRTLLVRTPLDRTDQEVGELLIGDAQGTLLALLGSDAPQLAAGNDALQEVIDRHGRHPLAAWARLARGANAGRHFQHITGGRIEVREPDIKESVTQLSNAIAVSRTDQDTGLDNLTLNAAMQRLARVHAKAGDLQRAEGVLDSLIGHFRDQGASRPVRTRIRQQTDALRTEIRRTAEG